jgi:serine/threonine protein kinase
MCIVFEAEHVRLRQAVAVKVLRPELASDRDAVTRFEREARAAAQLRSANVARVHDVDWTPDGKPYITMELLVGHDLGTDIQSGMPLPVDIAVDYVRQAAAGMAEAHALGIVHRDLKPENLFLTELGAFTDRKLVKILDFGIAKNVADSARRLTTADDVFGTVDYMSPEQIRSASNVDHRTDIWSLGVILYELLTGRLPFRGDARSVIAQIVSDPVPPPSLIVPHLPPQLESVVMRALEKDPAKRYHSAEELRAALAPFVDLEPITSVLAQLPPESMPRRAASSIGAGAHRPEIRTNVSWETSGARRGQRLRWLVLPFTAACAMAAGFVILQMRGERIADYYRAATGAPASATSVTPEPATPRPAPAEAVASEEPAMPAMPVESLPEPIWTELDEPPNAAGGPLPPPAKRPKTRPRGASSAAPPAAEAPAPAVAPALPRRL